MRKSVLDPLTVLRHIILILLAVLCVTACSSGSTTIVEHPPVGLKAHSITVVEGTNEAVVESEDIGDFENRLSHQLYETGDFTHGDDLTLTYRFLHFDAGSRAARWLSGGLGGTGESSITVEAVYSDKTGQQLGKIVSDGKLGVGFFGGSSDYAVERAADEIADYTRKTFK